MKTLKTVGLKKEIFDVDTLDDFRSLSQPDQLFMLANVPWQSIEEKELSFKWGKSYQTVYTYDDLVVKVDGKMILESQLAKSMEANQASRAAKGAYSEWDDNEWTNFLFVLANKG